MAKGNKAIKKDVKKPKKDKKKTPASSYKASIK